MPVSNARFNNNYTYFLHKDGSTMSATLAVLLPNFWSKDYEKVLLKRSLPIDNLEDKLCKKTHESEPSDTGMEHLLQYVDDFLRPVKHEFNLSFKEQLNCNLIFRLKLKQV